MKETSLVVEDLQFSLRRSKARKTVGITVERDGTLILSAPENTPDHLLREVVEEKREWIYTKLAKKELLFKPRPAKEFVDGEGFFYLGRSYRLQLVDPVDQNGKKRPTLRLHRGYFELRRDEVHRGREHFIRWYREHAHPWLQRKVDLWKYRLGVQPTEVRVMDLGYRWGSCGASGNLNFHWRTILLPASIVEYVVAHELAHLHQPHHTPQFWEHLDRAMPDYVRRKQWLAENGGEYGL
ncbi:hypothetical protein SAMN04488112_11487 [Melghirimyces thermohalophilus]|uniref:YgjP-like metallopeptidase domain-containing protein n=1 Tax=Melghirimyces thermohalophilus TaxID=1236220 RepID=A0A1G6NYW5_9BACL|nr:SprT family zinc-dependent metalloprotease [Melghirimyces thermohalophilus]SDC72456.1 hypothetical protein SAMN04488112_11487 [Melghirimyces thermohalophilus]